MRLFSKSIFLLVLAFFTGCSTTNVQCPKIENPQLAALVDHGKHNSLIVEKNNNMMIRYVFGDWNYYALANQNLWTGFKALFLPTTSTLGKKTLHGQLSEENIRNLLPVLVKEVYIFKVESHKIDQLTTKLDSIYQNNQNSEHYNHFYDLFFVKYPENYSLFNNSNNKVSQWIVELGCQVH